MCERGRLVRHRRLTRLGVIFPRERLLARLPIRQAWLRLRRRRHRLALSCVLRSARDCTRVAHAATVARAAAAAAPAATASTPASSALPPLAAVRAIGSGFAGRRGGRWRGSRCRIAPGSLRRGSGGITPAWPPFLAPAALPAPAAAPPPPLTPAPPQPQPARWCAAAHPPTP